MKPTRVFAAALLGAAISAGAFAALSDTNTQFGKGPAQYLMTREESAAWKNVKDDAEAQAFINTFWARRDPTPTTPENELRGELEARVKYADEHFAEGRTKGSLSDRGRVFIVMGSPALVRRSSSPPNALGPPPSSGVGIPTPQQELSERNMIWVYDQAKTKVALPAPSIQVAFVDQFGNDIWRLDRSSGVDVNAMLQRTAAAAVTNPNATGAPVAQAAPAQPAAVAPAAPAAATAPATVPVGTFKTEALKAAVDSMRAAKQNPYKNLYLSWGEFVTPTGQYFIPVQLYVPAAAGVTAESSLTFFGLVEDGSGTPVAIFEEPAKLLASKGDFVFDRTLKLSPGTYKGTFGLADNAKPVSMVSTTMTLKGLDKGEAGISDLILSNNIYPLTAAQAPTDPYAFGGMKVIPKSDKTFTTAEELWYFYELRNPGIDVGTNLPKIQMKLSLSGKTTAGKEVRMENPLSEVDTIELKGVPGHFGVGQSLLLQTFKPGDYIIKVKVIDMVTKQNYTLEQSFKIAG